MKANTVRSSSPRVLGACLLVLALASPALADNDGLVAYWSLDGTLTDSGPSSLIGMPVGDAGFADGKVGQGLLLDGTDDYVQLTDPAGEFPTALGSLSQGTVSVWFKFTQPTATNVIHPVFYMGQGTGGPGQTGVVL